jgi:L-fuculose-phosphate aldolase
MCASGSSLKSAYGLALTMEWCAEVQWRCMCAGKMNVLTKKEMDTALEHYKTYGQGKSDGSSVSGYNG